MKKLMVKTFLVILVACMPVSAIADVRVHVNIPLPPPIFFPAPPQLVVIPETDVYVVPDAREDIFFYGGWWWRPWNNRWYRSQHYDRGWAYHPNPPYFHRSIPSDWRYSYRNHSWKGYRWEPQRTHHQDIQRNWNVWQKDRYWEKQRYGVREMKHKRFAPQYRSETRKTVTKSVVRHRGEGPGDSRYSGRNDRRPSGGRDRR
ncbi:MAG TPA: hypothetical protein PKJ10_00485 [Smithella sp.]|nr:hypothetical protein [Smithella sp.]